MEKIKVFDLDGNFLAEYDNYESCSMDLKIDFIQILKSVKDNVPYQCFQFFFSKHVTGDTVAPKHLTKNVRIKKAVGKYFRGKLISTYESITEAYICTGIRKGAISNSIKHGWFTNNFLFKEIKP